MGFWSDEDEESASALSAGGSGGDSRGKASVETTGMVLEGEELESMECRNFYESNSSQKFTQIDGETEFDELRGGGKLGTI